MKSQTRRIGLVLLLFVVAMIFGAAVFPAVTAWAAEPANPRCSDPANQVPLPGKVCVLHTVPNDNPVWIEIPCAALPAHIAHGDPVGVANCDPTPAPTETPLPTITPTPTVTPRPTQECEFEGDCENGFILYMCGWTLVVEKDGEPFATKEANCYAHVYLDGPGTYTGYAIDQDGDVHKVKTIICPEG